MKHQTTQEEVAIHEACHFVANRLMINLDLGFINPTKITMNPTNGQVENSGVYIQEPTDTEKANNFTEAYKKYKEEKEKVFERLEVIVADLINLIIAYASYRVFINTNLEDYYDYDFENYDLNRLTSAFETEVITDYKKSIEKAELLLYKMGIDRSDENLKKTVIVVRDKTLFILKDPSVQEAVNFVASQIINEQITQDENLELLIQETDKILNNSQLDMNQVIQDILDEIQDTFFGS